MRHALGGRGVATYHGVMVGKAVLERYSVLRADDVDAFRVSVSSVLTPHQITPVGRGDRAIQTGVAVAPLGPLSLIYGQHRGMELAVKLTEQLDDYYDVNLSFGGRNRITCGNDEVFVDQHTAGIISPRMQAKMHLSTEYRQLHVRIERFALERHLEALMGRPVHAPIRFDPTMDLRSPAAASWAQAVRLLVADLDEPTGLATRLPTVSPWSEFLMSGLLLAQQHNYSETLAESRDGVRRPAPVKRAVDLIESSPESDLSIERLAREAGISARSLQRHFRDYVGLTPREYVQQVRLARVHADLAKAGPGDGETVADIALRWGFGHVPRFAGVYQARYGVAPSVTLRELPV